MRNFLAHELKRATVTSVPLRWWRYSARSRWERLGPSACAMPQSQWPRRFHAGAIRSSGEGTSAAPSDQTHHRLHHPILSII